MISTCTQWCHALMMTRINLEASSRLNFCYRKLTTISHAISHRGGRCLFIVLACVMSTSNHAEQTKNWDNEKVLSYIAIFGVRVSERDTK
jgi:hypothetical protein